MELIKPFPGLLPDKKYLEEIVAPPYDVITSEEARIRVKDKAWSFLHISKPEIDLDPEIDQYDDQVYQKGLDNLRAMLDEKILVMDQRPAYYIYQMIKGDHRQTGLVAVISIDAYNHDQVLKHELTRPEKEMDRIQHIDCLNGQTSPVLLTFKPSEAFKEYTDKIESSPPLLSVKADQDVVHQLWRIDRSEDIALIEGIFNRADQRLYIADGHHRSAAASKVAELRNKSEDNGEKTQPHNYFLGVSFPSDQMKIMDYNRIITGLNGLNHQSLLEALQTSFIVLKSSTPYKPEAKGTFGLCLSTGWYKLAIKAEITNNLDLKEKLDTNLLYNYVLKPLFGIKDQRTDSRLDFIGGIKGLKGLEERVGSHENKAAFSLFPTSMEEIMSIADSGDIMPPKSTWFEPKLIDGLIAYLF